MVKNAIHVFYTKPQSLGTSFFAFPNIRVFYMSAYLSLKCLRDKNYRTKLITDELGKKYLIDNFGLQYDEVTTELEGANISPYLWGMAKMYAFSLQKEPFLYIDLDAFLFNDIDISLKKSEIFFQNYEDNYYTAYDTYCRFNKYFASEKNEMIKAYEETLAQNRYGDAYNTAIFGGNNINLIKAASEEILRYCRDNMWMVEDKYIGDRLSVWMEQVYMFYFLKHAKLYDRELIFKGSPEVHLKDSISERLDFFNKWREDYVHMISFEKFNLNMIRGLNKATEKTSFERMEMNSWGLNYNDLLGLTRNL